MNANKATTLNTKSVGALLKDWMSLVGIAILIVVLLVKPTGILGRNITEKV